MYSNRSDYDYENSRPHNSRESRPWRKEGRSKEWTETSSQDLYKNYDKYSHGEDDRVPSSSSRSETFTREHSPDRNWRRKRRLSIEKSGSEKKRRTFGDEDNRRYEARDVYKHSPEQYPDHTHRNDDYKYSQFKEESQCDSDDQFRDREKSQRGWNQEETRLRDDFKKSYTPPRRDSFTRDHDDFNHNRTMFSSSLNGSSRQIEPYNHRRLSPPPISPPPPYPPPASQSSGVKPMSKGFQLFLNVLNMGVNVDTLTQIVNQSSSSPQYGDEPRTVELPERKRLFPQPEKRPASSYSPPPRPFSSNGKTLSEEMFSESRNFDRNFPENTHATSPSNEDDSKRKQMHNVLKALGIQLESEEVGQMSNRIQERLYGKKQTEQAPLTREEVDRERRRSTYVPKRRSRSSSDSSSGSFKNHRKSHLQGIQNQVSDISYYTCQPVQMVSPAAYPVPAPELPPPQGLPNLPTNLPPVFLPPVPLVQPLCPQPPPQPAPHFPQMNMYPPVVPPNPPMCPLSIMPHPFFPDLLIPFKQGGAVEVNTPMSNVQTSKNTKSKKQNSNNNRPRWLQKVDTSKKK